MKKTLGLTTAASLETAGLRRSYLCEVEGAVRGERGHFAGVFGDVAVKARRWIKEVLHVFVDAFHFPLERDKKVVCPCERVNTRRLIQQSSVQTWADLVLQVWSGSFWRQSPLLEKNGQVSSLT